MPSFEAVACRTALADLLFAPPAAAERRLTALRERELVPLAIAVAAQWRIVSALRARIERFANDAERAEFRRLGAAAAAQSALTVHRSRAVVAAFAAAGIDTLAIKGVALVPQLYGGDVGARMIGDLDLVVREASYQRAARVLGDAGYMSINPPFEEHIASIASSSRLHNFSRTFEADGLQVDIHWRFGVNPPAALDVERLFARSEVVPLRGTPLRVAAPADAMMVTAHHALRGYFNPQSTLKDVADVAAWWTRARERWSLDDVLAAALESDLATSLLALWFIVARRDAGHPCVAGIAALEAALGAGGVREARRLADFFEGQLTDGDYTARTVEVFARPQPRGVRRSAVPSAAGSDAAVPRPAARPVKRRPLVLRALGFAGDQLRVARQVCNVRRIPAYRAVAEAQARFR